jgi:pimeloyl-ACP methyl ester carboxylesterase
VRPTFALLCHATLLLAAFRWTDSTGGFLVLGFGLTVLLDRYAVRLLPWSRPAWLRETIIAACAFVVGTLAFYLARPGIVPLSEAGYRGLVACIVCLSIDVTMARFGRVGWLAAFALVVLLIPIIGGLHPLRTVPKRTPAAMNLAFEDIRFETHDGVKLAGWLIPHSKPCGNVIFCHGHGRNRGHGAGLFPTLHTLGLNILAFDFRGHGDSEGHASTFGHREVEDLLSAERYLGERCPGQPLLLVGVSLGAAVSLQALPDLPNVCGVWSEGAFARLSHAIDYNFSRAPGAVRAPLVDFYHLAGWIDCGLWAPSVSPLDRLRGTTVPILFCHAMNDELVPFSEGKALYDAYTGPKQRWWVEETSHYNVRQQHHDEYPQRLRAFVEECLKKSERAD